MIQKIKNLFIAFSSVFVLGLVAVPATAAAASCTDNGANNNQQQCLNGNLCAGSNFDLSGGSTGQSTDKSSSSNCNDQGNNSLSGKIKKFLNILSALIGVVAVIMIIYAGFRYVTSAGSEGGVKAAKNAIIYAIIGLVVVALAQVIVHFVISNTVS